MKKAIVFSVMLFVIVLAVQAAQDFTFSLSGGSVHGKFTLAGDFLYAQEFGSRFFVQTAGFANLGQEKEYGGSLGLGILTDEGGDIYLFADSLYAYGKFWTQLRPTARLRFSWLSLMAFYALPITKSTIQIDEQEVGAVKYWGGELNLVPVSWARVYGNLMSIGKTYAYRFGAEVRPIKWLSVSADWNKTNAGSYSKWNSYQDVRVAINLLLGNQQQRFSPTIRVQVTPMYPILAKKVDSTPPDPWLAGGELEIQYRRVNPIIYPNAGGVGTPTTYHNVYGGQNASQLIKTGENTWMATISLGCSPQAYWIWLFDTLVSKEPVAYELSIRRKGDSQWLLMTCIVVNPFDSEGQAAKVIFNNGKLENPAN